MVTQTIDREKIHCAFCHGKGTDPYNQLSEKSECAVCHGEGSVSVQVGHVPCAFCKGTGSDKTFTCPVCAGKGVIEPPAAPTCVCPDCGGRGFDGSSGLSCLPCHGLGQITAVAQSD